MAIKKNLENFSLRNIKENKITTMAAHNHVMKKYGHETKTTDDIRKLVGKGAASLIGRSVWGQAKKEFSKITNEKIKKENIIRM